MSRFDPELGKRLKRVYSLRRAPENPDEFFRLLKAESTKHQGTKKFLDLVKSKKAVTGMADSPSRDWIIVGGAKKTHTLCSYDTLMTGVLQGEDEIGSSCPHCGQGTLPAPSCVGGKWARTGRL